VQAADASGFISCIRFSIDIFELGENGLVTNVVTQRLAGMGPFSWKFARHDVLVVAKGSIVFFS
jgi:hypothetical protein